MPNSISQLLITGSFKEILGVPWFTIVSLGVFAGRHSYIRRKKEEGKRKKEELIK
jgi:hypothetical protein